MKRRTTTRRTTAPQSQWKRTNTNTAPAISLFNGNIEDLINELEPVSKEITDRYLKFANQTDKATATEKLLKGDAETFTRYQSASQAVKIQGYNSKEFTLNNEGLFFDVSTYLTGQPEHWINEVETTAPGPAKDLKINLFAPYWTTENDIFTKLIKIVELIDATEAAGQRLSIKAVTFCEGREEDPGQAYTFEVEIKKESQPINIQQLVYLIANPIILRYAMCSLQHHAGHDYNPISNITTEEQEMKNENAVYIPSISYDFKNKICYTGGQQFNYEKLNPAEQYNIKL